MKKILFILTFLITTLYIAYSQDSLSHRKTKKWLPELHYEGYIEAYYFYNFNMPVDGNMPGFYYSFNRHNEFNINLAYIKGSALHDRYRANFALMAGTYANANLSDEPIVLRYILEANIGVRFAKGLWLDAGIFPSYIGFESAVGADCWTVTRSILADNSPYYFSGVKLGYTSLNNKFSIAGFLTNGWQNVIETPFNSNKATGLQLQLKPNDKILINYSNFIGYETPDSNQLWRFFNNFYGIFDVHPNFQLTTGFDIGLQEKTVGNLLNPSIWFSPVIIMRFPFAQKFSVASRIEYYQDKDGVIIHTGSPKGMMTSGYSINFDYRPWDYILCRIEGKLLYSHGNAIFNYNNGFRKISPFIGASISFKYGR